MCPLTMLLLCLCRLYQLIPCDNIDKPMYLSTSLKWSSKDSNSPVGHPRLHQVYNTEQLKP